MSGGVTANYGLSKPNFNTRPWDGIVNNNWDLIDTILYTIAQVPNIAGIWKNSTMYPANVNVLDPQSLVFYTSLVANTSAATGTFAADRLANPANWTLTQPQQGAVRYDQGQALTAGQGLQALQNILAFNSLLRFDAAQTLSTTQIAQAIANIGAYNSLLRFDAAQTLTYNQALQVLNTLGIDGTETTIASAATTDIGNVTTQNVVVSGTTAITSFGVRPNKYKLIRFTDVLTLTNGTALILPTGANITTAAGDTAIATSDATGNWRIRAYQKADGTSLLSYVVPAAPSSAVTLSASDFDKPYNPTGTTTITVGNVGPGFRTGPIKNSNPITGLITIAVPNGATLDGVANATLILFPYQKARIIQTGATSYVSEWLDRTPVIVQSNQTTSAAAIDNALPVGFSRFRYSISDLQCATSGGVVGFRVSDSGVANLQTSGYTYVRSFALASSSGADGGSAAQALIALNVASSSQTGISLVGDGVITPGGTGKSCSIIGRAYFIDAQPTRNLYSTATDCPGSIGRVNFLRLFNTAGNINGNFTVIGEP